MRKIIRQRGTGPRATSCRNTGRHHLGMPGRLRRNPQDAAAKGIEDSWVMPTHVIFLAIIYPIFGLFLACMTFGYDVMPLLFPLAAGLALIGPFAAIGLYELSRQREKGVDVSWNPAVGMLRCRSLHGIAAIGTVLLCL